MFCGPSTVHTRIKSRSILIIRDKPCEFKVYSIDLTGLDVKRLSPYTLESTEQVQRYIYRNADQRLIARLEIAKSHTKTGRIRKSITKIN